MPLQISNSICVFCCKTTDCLNDKLEEDSRGVQRFIKLFARYIGNDEDFRNCKLNCDTLSKKGVLKSCQDCHTIIDQFCSVYHQIKCLEMKLNWKLQKLKNVMEDATRVPSRVKLLQTTFENQRVYKTVKEFRKEFIKICSGYMSKALPIVVVRKIPSNINSRSIKKEKDIVPQPSDVDQQLIEWFSSFAIVLLLYFSINTGEDKRPFPESEDMAEVQIDEDISKRIICRQIFPSSPEEIESSNVEIQNDTLEPDDRHNLIVSPAHSSYSNSGVSVTSIQCSLSSPEPTETLKCKKKSQETTSRDVNDSHQSTSTSEGMTQLLELCKPKTSVTQRMEEEEISTSLEAQVEAEDHSQPKTCNEKPSSGPNNTTTDNIETHGKCEKVCATSPPDKVDENPSPVLLKETKSLWCRICKKMYPGRCPLKDHILVRTDKQHRSFSCHCCKSKFSRLSDLNRHRSTLKHKLKSMSIRKRKPVKEIKLECDKSDDQSEDIPEYVKVSSSRSPRLRSMFQCKICKLTCSSSSRLETHVKYIHKNIDEAEQDEDNSDIDLADDNLNSDGSDDEYLEICSDADEMLNQSLEKPLEDDDGIHDSGSQNNDEKLFVCHVEKCKMRFSLKSEFWQHNKLHNQRVPHKRTNFCKIEGCIAAFKSVEELDNHKKLHGSFKCDFCTVVKEYAPHLAIHEMTHLKALEIQPNLTTSIKKAKLNLKASGSEDVKKQFTCARCSYTTLKQSVFLNHYFNAHLGLGSIGRICSICKAPLVDGRNHFRTHHDTSEVKPNAVQRCNECPAYFLRLTQLSTHKRKVHGIGKEAVCGVCNKKMNSVKVLRHHMRKKHQQGDYNFICDIGNCGTGYTDQVDLERHKCSVHGTNTSTIREPVNCPVCNKHIVSISYLKFHMRVHEEKVNKVVKLPNRFVCEQCGKAFKTKILLEQHYLFHAGPDAWQFMCSICSKKCFSQQKLDEHQRTHTKEKPFICEVCGEKYAHRHNWRHHVTKKHGIDVPVKAFDKTNLTSRKGQRKQKSTILN